MHNVKITSQNQFEYISDLDTLLTIEAKLYELENENPNEETKEQLIQLFERMWELDPENSWYANSIANLYLTMGWDLKRRTVNYEKAQRYFKEVIRLKRPNRVPIAEYRLGFIFYATKDWKRCIQHLESALQRGSKVEAWAKLDEQQAAKAYRALTLAYKNQLIETAQHAERALQAAGHPTDEIDEIMELLADETEEEFPFIRKSGNQSIPMTEREYRSLIRSEQNVILDCTDQDHKHLYVEGARYAIAGKNLELLTLLLKSTENVRRRQIEDDLEIPNVSLYMGRLKQFLARCELPESAIVNERGYRWDYPDTFLIHRVDDVEFLV